MSEKILLEKITTSGLIQKNDRIVIGLSGGPDSTALALLLDKLKNKYNLSLSLAHVNYHLRGKDSEKDEKFCKDLASKLELPLFLHSVKKNIFNNKHSLQNTARKIRHEYFLRIAKKHKANKIALAHQADDQAETVLMNLLRGSGKQGLSGISGHRLFAPKIQLIHPLLPISRKDIINFLKNKNTCFREDSSNNKTLYTRNRIRLELIPFLEKKYQSRIKEHLNDLAKIWALENEYLENISEKNAKRFVLKNTADKILVVNAKKLIRSHPAIQARILQLYARNFTSGYNLNFDHIRAIQNILKNKRSKFNLPQKLTVEKIGDKLLFYCNN
ncbi:MAG: tRNA lysidine(34) synthetase TilS [bacterium]|nr:tRNA lysidine(34) synthetase TilS [bacterium]